MDNKAMMSALGLRLPLATKMALLHILNWSSATGSCAPVYGMLAGCMGCSSRYASLQISQLEAEGYIRVIRRKNQPRIIFPVYSKIRNAYVHG